MRALVTGGTGFVGGRLAERLALEEGATVRVLVRNWARAVWVSRLPVELLPGAVNDPASLAGALADCDVVFHCASGGSSDDEYFRTNVEGTRNLLDAARTSGVKRFVYVSTIAVHGPTPPDNANESDEYRHLGRGYSRSKIDAERLVLRYGEEFGLPVSIVRPTFVWGPRSGLFTVRPLKAMKEGTFRLVDEGQGDCHAVYIEHLVDLLLAAGLRSEAIGEVFLATDGFGVKWREFYAHYSRWLGLEHLPSISSRSPAVRLKSHAVEHAIRLLDRWQGNPAPLWRRVCRRATYEVAGMLRREGIPNSWDLAKFARRGGINASKAERLLGHRSAWTLEQAMEQTERWVRDQMGTELGLGEALAQQ
jgi:nucleoside-diphosphate-sugar epimerase